MRTEKMRIDNMEKVFKAAMTLFSKQNVTNTTLQMIADEAGVSTRSIVNYFNTRENLLLATHQRYIEYAFGELRKFCETEEYQKLNGREQVLAKGIAVTSGNVDGFDAIRSTGLNRLCHIRKYNEPTRYE